MNILFSECPSSSLVWQQVRGQSGIPKGPLYLDCWFIMQEGMALGAPFQVLFDCLFADIMDWLAHDARGNGFRCSILRCPLTAWRERNQGTFSVVLSYIAEQVSPAATTGIREFLKLLEG